MAVTDKHPQYIAAQKSWEIMRDAVAGEEQIKQAQTKYLAKSAGMIEAEKQGDTTGEIYKAYLSRAQYPLWVQDALRTMIGLVSKLEPNIVIESSLLKGLIENATNDGFGLKQLFIRICSELLEFGRCGLLVDVDGAGVPYFALYDALSIINWKENSIGGRKDLKLLVLEEQFENSEDEFGHDTKTVHRVLSMVDGALTVRLFDGSVEEDKTPDLGGNQLSFTPFVFCGTTDNSPQVGTVPLLTMAKAALKYYQLSADYYQSLHHTAHPQPWINGLEGDEDISVTGVMAVWSLPSESQCGYLEISGSGIELTKKEMDAQKNSALEAGAKVIDTNSQESGEARRARQDDQQASLHSIVTCAAAAIEQAIKYAAQWLKLDSTKYAFTVEPEFIVQQYDINLAKQLYEGAIAGKNSFRTYWEYLMTGKLPAHDYQEEVKRVEGERDSMPL
ncbi:TPA: DUF4055 domain-containing protein [Acinetobacter baumannii]|uniref:DUF4055 domain-containing protein n=61 Tax=Acinetobacter calcoaceticus/baumannii complex TaxID=909768 RepID=A0ABX6CDF7_ACIB2|nr:MULTISPECIES: DUF4055 domain-containing protein [Acinetobacter]ADX91596.1 hypothetical protein ABTW07_1167 [Acinetobacter baumannii TCDC-AB0715]AHX29726.1 hypothetical protein A478_14320 [Acinetobacter baumannii AC12]AHX66236.1 hypothetical protein B856_13340 [Acinetobacter baumannii AC30]EXB09480.1 hypothetical protein J513_3067 [Acinetobacter baumannii 1397084]EYD08830.1 hypothetical protein J935_2667 [Acinetobacter baumannii 44362_2]KCW27791.1 hypothetical protein J474_4491 [Acinetobact